MNIIRITVIEMRHIFVMFLNSNMLPFDEETSLFVPKNKLLKHKMQFRYEGNHRIRTVTQLVSVFA